MSWCFWQTSKTGWQKLLTFLSRKWYLIISRPPVSGGSHATSNSYALLPFGSEIIRSGLGAPEFRKLKICKKIHTATIMYRATQHNHKTKWNITYYSSSMQNAIETNLITSMPKVILEEGLVAALSHTYAVKCPLVTMAHSKFAPKSTPSRGSIPKLHYLPHPWTRPTYDAKRHPDPIRRFTTMHWTDQRMDAPTDAQANRLSTGKFDDYRPLRYESDAA